MVNSIALQNSWLAKQVPLSVTIVFGIPNLAKVDRRHLITVTDVEFEVGKHSINLEWTSTKSIRFSNVQQNPNGDMTMVLMANSMISMETVGVMIE